MRYFLLIVLLNASLMAFAKPKQVLIPSGSFQLGCSVNDKLCELDEGVSGGVLVNVPAFFIDTQETSVAEYRACVDANVCQRPFDFRRTHYCNYDAPKRDDYPINCINWNMAATYCQWRGGRLAYEVEWERAARANTNTPYYWGYQPADCTRAVIDAEALNKPDTETDGCWRDLSWPRNSYKPNSFGLYDMIGGLSEWVMDWYDPNSHANLHANGKLTGPKTGKLKMIKGGSWDEKHWAQRVSNRFAKPVTGNPDLYGSNGIRCVTPMQNSLTNQP